MDQTERIEPVDARRASPQDLQALIGVAAVLEGAVLSGELDPLLVAQLCSRFRDAGLLLAGDEAAQLRVAVSNLNHRLRYVAGEYPRPPKPLVGHADQLFGFSSEDTAAGFLQQIRAHGGQGSVPVVVDGRAYKPGVSWEVTVHTADLPLTAEFNDHERSLIELARRHGGQHGGSQG